MEVADQGCGAPGIAHPRFDLGNSRGGFRKIDGHPHELGAGFRELNALPRGGRGIGGIGHRHRLHDDRGTAADLDVPHAHGNCLVESRYCWHLSRIAVVSH